MADSSNYGLLLNTDIKLHRQWFIEMCSLIGIKVIFRAPLPNKTYSGYGELNAFFNLPQLVGCIFEEHPTQQTLKKLEISEIQTLILKIIDFWINFSMIYIVLKRRKSHLKMKLIWLILILHINMSLEIILFSYMLNLL